MLVAIRQMNSQDAEAVAELLPDLGYEATPERVVTRLAALREWPDQDAFVALVGEAIAGLCQVQGVRLLASDGYAEVQALVVAASAQRHGVGKALLKHAAQWAFSRGYRRVRLRSGLHREPAHLFYQAVGFTRSRASYAFEMQREQNDA